MTTINKAKLPSFSKYFTIVFQWFMKTLKAIHTYNITGEIINGTTPSGATTLTCSRYGYRSFTSENKKGKKHYRPYQKIWHLQDEF